MAGHDWSNDTTEPTVLQLCDDGANLAPFLRHYTYTGGTLTASADTELDGVTPYALVGNAAACAGVVDIEKQILCDNQGGGVVTKFIRYAVVNTSTGAVASVFDADLAGATYVVAGTVESCDDSTSFAAMVLCDDTLGDGTVVVKFLRHYVYSDLNTVASVFDTDLDGAAYTALGTVGDCSDIDPTVLPSVVDQAADGTVNTGAGVYAVSVTNMSAIGTVTVAGTSIPVGFNWNATAPEGAGLASIAVVVAGGGRAIVTQIPRP